MDEATLNLILKIVIIVVPIVWAIIKAKYGLDKIHEGKVTAIIEQAVTEVYTEFVRNAKAKDKDGKLSIEEIKTARDMAFKKAVEIAKTKGIDFAGEIAVEYFPVLLDKVIKTLKK